MQVKTLHNDHIRLQLGNITFFLKVAVLIAVGIYILDFIFYTGHWDSLQLTYSAFGFLVYLALLFCIYILAKKEIRKAEPSRKSANAIIYSATYLISTYAYVDAFINKFYGHELYVLASLNLVFGIMMLFNRKERLVFSSFMFVLYIIGDIIVSGDSPSIYADIAKAFLLNVLTFYAGGITYKWYMNLKKSNLNLKSEMEQKVSLIHFLSDELGIEKDENLDPDNMEKLNTAVVGLLKDFSESKIQTENALAEAQKASKARDDFFANMSHELRTPLDAIIGILRDTNSDKLTNENKRNLQNIDKASKYLLSIVNNSLDLSKLQYDQLNLAIKDFSLKDILKDTKSLLYTKSLENKINFKIRIDESMANALRGDESRVRQILFNVVGNAIKFTYDADIILSTKVLASDEEGQKIKISIQDQGRGMSEDFLKKIFEKYSQEENASENLDSGSGLGMTITYELVKAMNGSIQVTSTPDIGTNVEVVLYFPFGEEVDDTSMRKPGFGKELNGVNALLVDDDKMNLMIAKVSLERFGCNIETASNGQEALDYIRERSFDVIIMDIQMPVLDGISTTKIIREELQLEIPILAFTANAFLADKNQYLENGMDDIITKPYNENDLFLKLKNLLNSA